MAVLTSAMTLAIFFGEGQNHTDTLTWLAISKIFTQIPQIPQMALSHFGLLSTESCVGLRGFLHLLRALGTLGTLSSFGRGSRGRRGRVLGRCLRGRGTTWKKYPATYVSYVFTYIYIYLFCQMHSIHMFSIQQIRPPVAKSDFA